jgi:hypothetical protein
MLLTVRQCSRCVACAKLRTEKRPVSPNPACSCHLPSSSTTTVLFLPQLRSTTTYFEQLRCSRRCNITVLVALVQFCYKRPNLIAFAIPFGRWQRLMRRYKKYRSQFYQHVEDQTNNGRVFDENLSNTGETFFFYRDLTCLHVEPLEASV